MNPFYKLLETFDELEEDAPTKVKKIGNQIEVDDGKGNKTMYDEKAYAELQAAEAELEEAKGYNPEKDAERDWEAGERSDRDFRNQERNAGLEDEEYTWNQQPWAVCFNGKPWKSFKGKQAAQNVG